MDLYGTENRVYLAVIHFNDERVRYCVFNSYAIVNKWYKDTMDFKDLYSIRNIGIVPLYMNHDWKLNYDDS